MAAQDSLREATDSYRKLRQAIAATVDDVKAERDRAALDNLTPIPPDTTSEVKP